jgi:hypothetical protein
MKTKRTGYRRVAVLLAWGTMAAGHALAAAVADHQELLLIGLHRGLLDRLFQQPISESQPVQEYVENTLMQGTALTSGTASAIPYPSTEGIGLSLLLQTTTDAYTLNTNAPRPDILVNFDWTIATSAVTRKDILCREDGFYLYPAQTNAQSAITINGLEASASGLFWRLKSRIAERMAWNQLLETKQQNEAQAAAKIAAELNQMVDARAAEKIASLQSWYRTYVYEPLITRGMLGGRLGMGSDNDWLAVVGTAGGDLLPVDAGAIPGLSDALASGGELVVRAHQSLLNQMVAQRFGGMFLTDVEIGEAVGRKAPEPRTVAEVLGSKREELGMTLDDEPLALAFTEGSIRMTLRLARLETLGKTVTRVAIPIAFTLGIGGDGGVTLIPQPIGEVRGLDGAAIDGAVARYARERVAALLPAGPVDLSRKTFFPSLKPTRVRSLSARDGQLTAGLDVVQP